VGANARIVLYRADHPCRQSQSDCLDDRQRSSSLLVLCYRSGLCPDVPIGTRVSPRLGRSSEHFEAV